MTTRKKFTFVGIVAVGVGVVVWLASRKPDHTAAKTPATAQTATTAHSSDPPRLGELVPDPEGDAPENPQLNELLAEAAPIEDMAAMAEKLRETKALYEKEMVYPPWSRPLDGSSPHLTNPNPAMKMGQPFAADLDRRELRADFVLDRWFIGPGETAVATMTVTRIDEEGVAFQPDSVSGRVEIYDPTKKGYRTVATLEFASQGAKYTALVVPGSVPALVEAVLPPEVRVVGRVEVGRFHKEFPIIVRYATRSPFTVLRLVDDRVVNGSLEIDFEIEATYASQTLVMAALYDRSGEKPIVGYEKHFFPIAEGKQIMTLSFFGKALNEAGISGHYRIKGLRGQVQKVGAEQGGEDLYWMSPDEPPRLTKHAYANTDFSPDDWSSPQKDAQIERYQKHIDRVAR